YTDMPDRIGTYTRECYINAATCLQKRAYDVMNGKATDMHEQMVRFYNKKFILRH
ncbi:unnamed protein product, partial [Rotaria socialis]